MIELVGARFAVVALVVIVLIRGFAVPARVRPWVFLAATVALFPWDLRHTLIALGAMGAYGWFALRTARHVAAFTVHLVVLTTFLVLAQHVPDIVVRSKRFAAWLPLLGAPYVYLRIVHLLVDVRGGTVERPAATEYFAWLLPFHQLIAGPIERFQAFRAKIAAALPPLTFDSTIRAFDRITNGLVKKLVLAEMIKRVAGFAFERQGWRLWVEMDLQALYVYLDFSGYMDIVIGVGMLVGWEPPENFDWPYLSRNIVVFWTRWHMTLSAWIRDYVFMPLNLTLQRDALASVPLLAGIACYLVSMTLCGLWHQTTASFALYGALHGLAIAVFKCFEAVLKRTLSKSSLRAFRASRVAAAVSTLLTFQFVAASLVFAFNSFGRAVEIVGRLV